MNRTVLLSMLLAVFSWQACENAVGDAPGSSNYAEPHRPQFHFSPAAKWTNDPNGLVYFENEYHLFYQYYPDSTVWGPMHWGHAVSKDLVHWEHLPVALYPDSLGYIFSGSAVVDWKNTSGFGLNDRPPLIAIFTHHSMPGERSGRSDYQYQSIAYSNDKGRTWTKYAGNPVIPNTQGIRDFRDPKVIWDEERQQWLMVFAANDHVKLWRSKDLKSWEQLSDWGKEYGAHGGVWECPDFFPMRVEETGETRWVLLQSINPGSPNGGSGTQYFVGDFNGTHFQLDESFVADATGGKSVWVDYGRDNYAGVTWSDIPKEDGRRIFLGWMSNWDYAQKAPTQVWRNAMTLPRALSLHKTEKGYRLFSQPVKELNSLREQTIELENEVIDGKINLSDKYGFSASQTELVLEFDLGSDTAARFGIELSNDKGETYRLEFDRKENRFSSDRTLSGDLSFSNKFAPSLHYAPRIAEGATLKMHLFIDSASVEMFADDGATVMTEIFFPTEDFNTLSLFAEGGEAKLKKGAIYQLKGIWNREQDRPE